MKNARNGRATLGVATLLSVSAVVGSTKICPAAEDSAVSRSGAVEWPTAVSPAALAATADGRLLFIAYATAGQVTAFDTGCETVAWHLDLPESPLGLALSKTSPWLYVACAAPESTICVVDTAQARITDRFAAGHTAMAPVLSPDEKRLYVCNRFDNEVSVFDVATRKELKRIRVEREPVAAAVTPDGKLLVVANHLHAQSANHLHIGAAVSVIDTVSLTVRKTIPLALGAGLLNGVAISPNSRFAAVTHIRSTYWLSTTGVELGRMNAGALSFLDLERLEVLGMIFLDHTAGGAAMPWAVAWTADGGTVAVTHAGAHALSLVDAPLAADRASFSSGRIGAYAPSEFSIAPVPQHRPVRLRQRVPLPGNGPRALALAGTRLYLANYFSGDLCRIDLSAPAPEPELLPLERGPAPSLERKGEMLFNDARLCFQGWQSCASCHDTDARTDALNWDLLNDGIANPKNTRSLVRAHQSGRAMALGVRANAEAAVRAGIHHILFTEQPEQVSAAIDAYLKSLKPVRSPHLANGRLSAAAQRGEQLFKNDRTGCVKCHPPPLFTDGLGHDVGTGTKYHSLYSASGADKPSDRFFSPPLVELWRTAPYLHDGSAVSLRDVLANNPEDRHGRTSALSAQEIDELVEYLRTL